MRSKQFFVLILLSFMIFMMAACGSASQSSTSGGGSTTVATKVPATAVPATKVPATTVPATSASSSIEEVKLFNGRGYVDGFWALYFNEPTGNSDSKTYHDGIDEVLASAIGNVRNTLDIAAFELNNEAIVTAIMDAFERGVTIRIVTDDEHGLEDRDEILLDMQKAGIPIVDDSRGALMHNKFMILDSTVVWSGSWNYTVNDTYRNNNNALVLRSQRAVQAYQAEFNEMFERKEFGSKSTNDGMVAFTQDGTEIKILFASEGNVIEAVAEAVSQAKSNVRFMTFVFSSDELATAMLDAASKNKVKIQGVFENRNSTADWSKLHDLYCAGITVRQDGNKYVLHHKVVIIDDDTVVTGSFNFSGNASQSNDENLMIIKNKDIAKYYIEEWQRMWDTATDVKAGAVTC